jgi:hypothetical protein
MKCVGGDCGGCNDWMSLQDWSNGCRFVASCIVYDLLVEVWHVLAAEIISYAKLSRSSGSDDHPCMSSKAEKFCSSEKCDESFFCSAVCYVQSL